MMIAFIKGNNLLCLNSDQQLISPCSMTKCKNLQVMGIKRMITKDGLS